MKKKQLKIEYFRVCKKLKLSTTDVVLTAGGALCILGLRDESQDLDLNIPEAKFQELKTKKFKTYFYGDVEVMPFTEIADLHIYHGNEKKLVVEGVTIPSIEELITLKETIMALPQRSLSKKEQDKIDIERLKKIL